MLTRVPRYAIKIVYTHRQLHSTISNAVFADAGSAEFLAGAAIPESLPRLHGLPEVIVTGRANVGKSTLLNTVLGRRDLLHISKKAGRTKTLNFYRVGRDPGKLVVVDAPGYGARGRPEWGTLFDHYLRTRTELRRVYILFNASHGLKKADISMLQVLHDECLAVAAKGHERTPWTLQSVITKADVLAQTGTKAAEDVAKIKAGIFDAAPTCLPPIITSSALRPPFGVDDMRRSIAEACGFLR